jgi:hypothetical protein
MVRKCAKCGENKDESQFYKNAKRKYHSYCIQCCAKNYQENRSRYLKIMHNRRNERRDTCLKHYGEKCACCGEERKEFLSIDHINGNGARHRKEIHRASIYYWLIKNNFPDGFRILCHNCNQAMGIYGYCPHQKESLSYIPTRRAIELAEKRKVLGGYYVF